MRITRALLAHAASAAARLLRLDAPADQQLSRYWRENRALGQSERAFVAEAAFAVLRRRRSLEAAAGSPEPRALVAAALLRVLGWSGRALEGLVDDALLRRIREARNDALPAAVRADLPDWLWQRLAAQHGEAEAMRIAQGLLNPAPLDLRVNLARIEREAAAARLAQDGLEPAKTPHSPAGLRLAGRPPINRHPLFADGLLEVQDEGSQLLAWVLAPRRGEMARAQRPDDHAGSVIRLHDDGRVPQDNPFAGRPGWKPEKFTLGNRNMQGAALHPQTGMLWTHEHGPQGGDEINVIRAGVNYGWPVITYGVNYGIGTRIGEGTQKPGMAQPLHYWVPSIAPSGMAFYSGDRFPRWQGNLFVGALRDQMLVRLQLDGEKVVREERLLKGVLGRIRDVRVHHGYVYVVTDESAGVVARLEP